MVGDVPPHHSDDERDDLAALDFSVTEGEQVESSRISMHWAITPRNPRRTTSFRCRCSP